MTASLSYATPLASVPSSGIVIDWQLANGLNAGVLTGLGLDGALSPFAFTVDQLSAALDVLLAPALSPRVDPWPDATFTDSALTLAGIQVDFLTDGPGHLSDGGLLHGLAG